MSATRLCGHISLACFFFAASQALGLAPFQAPVWWWLGIALGMAFRELGELI